LRGAGRSTSSTKTSGKLNIWSLGYLVIWLLVFGHFNRSINQPNHQITR
jgi:hypothetical protein